MKNIVSIFWTGGYDSTFRIVQLSRCNVTIQPIYLSNDRVTENYELAAIGEITKMLTEHPSTIADFLPLKVIKTEAWDNETYSNKEIADAYRRILSNDYVGWQYVWIADYSEKNPNVEMSIHQDDKAISIILKYGRLKKNIDNIIGEYYTIDKEYTPNDIVKIWGNLRFPLVYFTKLDMKEFYDKEGYSHIAQKTWFCHHPIDGKACGVCNPCKYTIEEGLKERFTKKALIRYYKHKYKTIIFNYLRKFKVLRTIKRSIFK